MISITGIPKTPIYENRRLRRHLVKRMAEDIDKTGRIDSPYLKAMGHLLQILDKEAREAGRLKQHLCQKVFV